MCWPWAWLVPGSRPLAAPPRFGRSTRQPVSEVDLVGPSCTALSRTPRTKREPGPSINPHPLRSHGQLATPISPHHIHCVRLHTHTTYLCTYCTYITSIYRYCVHPYVYTSIYVYHTIGRYHTTQQHPRPERAKWLWCSGFLIFSFSDGAVDCSSEGVCDARYQCYCTL